MGFQSKNAVVSRKHLEAVPSQLAESGFPQWFCENTHDAKVTAACLAWMMFCFLIVFSTQDYLAVIISRSTDESSA
jgi:hypothetical protein